MLLSDWSSEGSICFDIDDVVKDQLSFSPYLSSGVKEISSSCQFILLKGIGDWVVLFTFWSISSKASWDIVFLNES